MLFKNEDYEFQLQFVESLLGTDRWIKVQSFANFVYNT